MFNCNQLISYMVAPQPYCSLAFFSGSLTNQLPASRITFPNQCHVSKQIFPTSPRLANFIILLPSFHHMSHIFSLFEYLNGPSNMIICVRSHITRHSHIICHSPIICRSVSSPNTMHNIARYCSIERDISDQHPRLNQTRISINLM